MSMFMLCARRLFAFRAILRKRHLPTMIGRFCVGDWPDSMGGHMVNVYAPGRSSALSPFLMYELKTCASEVCCVKHLGRAQHSSQRCIAQVYSRCIDTLAG
jgi:hypothetical protein